MTPDAHDREAAMGAGPDTPDCQGAGADGAAADSHDDPEFRLADAGRRHGAYDAPEVFQAIERSNPYAREVRRRFFNLASELDAELEGDLA